MRKTLIIILALFAALLLYSGCGGGGAAPVTTAPKITNVEIYNVTDLSTPISVLSGGDNIIFLVYATDPDLDMTELTITQYYLSVSDDIYSGPSLLTLVPQPQPQADIIYQSGIVTVLNLPGNWRADFEITDKAGNESSIYQVNYTRI